MKRKILLLVVAVLAWPAVACSGKGMGQDATTTRQHGSSASAAQSDLPFTFFFTHYVMMGDDAKNPIGIRYESTGQPSADNPNGDRIAMSGSGAWDPATEEGTGGGDYVITELNGRVMAKGNWTVQSFVSFLQLPGWWGIEGLVEEGWQGPIGSPSFAGFLKVQVTLDDGRSGELTAWSVMTETPHYGGHVLGGISLRGEGLDFTDSSQNEMGLEGVMFYGPGSA